VQRKPLINLNQLVDLDELLYEGDDIEDDFDSTLINTVASTVQKWRMWVQLLNRLADLDEM
jgi:hypothetical protein